MNYDEIMALQAIEADRRRREGPAARAFREADVRFQEALTRVMCASTSRNLSEDWWEFRDALADFNRAAEERHIAKYFAEKEALYSCE